MHTPPLKIIGLTVVGLLCTVAIVVLITHPNRTKHGSTTARIANGASTTTTPLGVTTTVGRQLQPFLQEYYTITQNETEEQRRSRVTRFVTSDLAKQLNWKFAGVPPGSAMTSHVDMSKLTVQTAHTAGQIYVIMPVMATVDEPGGHEYDGLIYNTDSVWQQDTANPARWTMIHFMDALVRR